MTSHLAEIAAGHCSVTLEEVERNEDDPELAQILGSLMWLQEELVAREAAKNQALQTQAETLQKLARQHDELLRSRALADELSTPIIRAGDGILLMPLIGVIDDLRAILIQQRLLDAILEQRARQVILEVTGLPIIQGTTARYLSKIARSVKMLGAGTVLAGVQPEVAKSLVSLDVELGALCAVRSFDAALQIARSEIARRRTSSAGSL